MICNMNAVGKRGVVASGGDGGGSSDVIFLASYNDATNQIIDISATNAGAVTINTVDSTAIHYLAANFNAQANNQSFNYAGITILSGVPYTIDFDFYKGGGGGFNLTFGDLNLKMGNSNGVSGDGDNLTEYPLSQTLTFGAWNYIRVTWDGLGTFRVYKNMTLIATAPSYPLSAGTGGELIFINSMIGGALEGFRITKQLLTTTPTFPLTTTP